VRDVNCGDSRQQTARSGVPHPLVATSFIAMPPAASVARSELGSATIPFAGAGSHPSSISMSVSTVLQLRNVLMVASFESK
jgi:hypothetical protein